jgi:hypothetical protein
MMHIPSSTHTTSVYPNPPHDAGKDENSKEEKNASLNNDRQGRKTWIWKRKARRKIATPDNAWQCNAA